MTTGIDTSVVLRLLTGEPDAQAREALRWLREAKASGAAPIISDLVASEVYFALQHHFGVSKAEALRQISSFVSGGDVSPDGVLLEVLATPGLATAKPGFVDRLLHGRYLAEGAAGMVTFERAAGKLESVEVLGSKSSHR